MKLTWRRFKPVIFSFLVLLLGETLTRILLFQLFAPQELKKASVFAKVFITGLRMDLAVNSWLLGFFLLWLLFHSQKSLRARWHKITFISISLIFWFSQVFSWVAEYFFFDEFHSRFNTVAVDYILYPYEVFVNLWESYPVVKGVSICIILSILLTKFTYRFYLQAKEFESPLHTRSLEFGVLAFFFVLFAATVNNSTTRFSGDRSVDEISNNGLYSLVFAANTRHLDYGAFYLSDTPENIRKRVQNLYLNDGVTDIDTKSMIRKVSGDASKKKLNVVILLEESFGSEFWGVLGRKDSLTPEMDALSNEGILFTKLYASGNRTVRGMEGVLASFPPLPGDSIVKRHLSDHVETIARVLKRDGYSTSFLYGGRGVFDGMRSFATRNGYDEFIEQTDFENPSFTTVWGVADEDLFKYGVQHLKKMHSSGKPFLATFLSVSNHKPYTYPKGRIPENPDEERREYAVKYSDYALGEFFRLAKKEEFYKDTIFVVVADHGARVYGSQKIPAHSYEIPMVILGPAVVQKPQKIDSLGCSLDVGPTILGLIGRPYQSMFFGRDLLKDPSSEGRVLINHNRDIGIFKKDWLAVFGINKTLEFYKYNPQTRDFDLTADVPAEAHEVAKDGVALFSLADELYTNEKYSIEPVQKTETQQ